MRKDVILGMSIGGVMLAVVVVYLSVSPSGKSNKHQAQVDVMPDGSGGAGDVAGAGRDLAETPITPAPATPKPEKKASPTTPRKDEPKLAAVPAGSATADVKPVVVTDEKKAPAPAPDATEEEEKPAAVAATNVERSDPKWGSLLWGQQNTPLIGTSETPDPNAATAALLEAAGDQSSVSKRTAIIVPPPSSSGASATPGKSPTTKPASGGTVAVASAASGAKSGTRQHTVTKNETFSTIAQAAYGSASYYPFILRANPNLDPTKLKPGMVINLPDPADVKPADAGKPAAAAGDAAVARHIEAATVDPKSEYRIQAGDSLHKIAQKLYGNTELVQKIYELNKGQIGNDPAKLKLGMVLKLPQAPMATAGR